MLGGEFAGVSCAEASTAPRSLSHTASYYSPSAKIFTFIQASTPSKQRQLFATLLAAFAVGHLAENVHMADMTRRLLNEVG